jgi:hypothetical protein
MVRPRQATARSPSHGHIASAPYHPPELETAYAKESEQHRIVPFPVRIHDAIMLSSMGWTADIRRLRRLGDFYRGWIRSNWPDVELHAAQTPEAASALAFEQQIETLILDLNFGARHESGIVIARRVMEARRIPPAIPTRIVFRTAHADNEGYLRQIERLVSDEKLKLTAWGFLDKDSIPRRIALNAFEQVFIYEIPHTNVFNESLRQPPFRQLSSLEYTALVYTCLGVTNFGIGWLLEHRFSNRS